MAIPATMDPNSPLHNSFGALYIGTVASAILYGICVLQAFLYFRGYRQDTWRIKAAVISVVTFGMIQLFLAVTCVYHYVITNFHDPSKLQYLFRPITVEALFIGANSGIVQIFYAYRIWRLSNRNRLLSSLVLLLICGEFGAGLTWTTFAFQTKTWRDLLRISPIGIGTNVLTCLVDIIIAGNLCILLHRARTGVKRTDSIINKLILFVISTGLLTTIFATAVFICLLISPDSLIYGSFYLCLGPLYTNSFLTTLNSRSAIADEFELKATAQRSTAKSIKFRIMTTQESIRDEERGEREACDVSFSNTNEPAKIRRGSLLTKGRNDSNDDFVP